MFSIPCKIFSFAFSEIVSFAGVLSGCGNPSKDCSSPVLYISVTISFPPINSPLIYSCGIVGQFPYSLIPSLISISSKTLNVTKSDPCSSWIIFTVLLENPHWGCLGFPFINNMHLLLLTKLSILCLSCSFIITHPD